MTQAGTLGWLAWLESTAAATAMRQSLWLYPIVEILHIIDAPDEATIRSALASDPWSPDLLQIRDIQPWTILLDADEDYA